MDAESSGEEKSFSILGDNLSQDDDVNDDMRSVHSDDYPGLDNHAYLGADSEMFVRQHSAYFEPGSTLTMPLVFLPHIVIFPGETLPLRMLDCETLRLITQRLRGEQDTFAFINTLTPKHIGTIIQIERIYEQGDMHLSVVGRGRQRFLLVKLLSPDYDHMNSSYEQRAVVSILTDDHVLAVPHAARQSFAYWRSKEFALFDGPVLVRRALHILNTSAKWCHFIGAMSVLPEIKTCERKQHETQYMQTDPTRFSFWLAANLNVVDAERQRLLDMSSVVDRLRASIAWLEEHETAIHCVGCHAQIADTTHIFCKQQAQAPRRHSDASVLSSSTIISSVSIIGTFVNPHGAVHQILTMVDMSLRHILLTGEPTLRDTWFPGYTWQCMHCVHCQTFLGWRYHYTDDDDDDDGADVRRQEPKVFYGLVRTALG